jgi:thioredoxin-related protein
MRLRNTCLFALLCVPFATPCIGQETKAEPAKKADIYDSKADVKQLVSQAVAKAKRDHSRVLVMFGGNWCGWCHKLHEVFKNDREIARVLLYEYQLVMADTQAPNGEELIKDLKVDTSKGVPYLVVLDEQGEVIARQETGVLEEGDHHSPEKVKNFLQSQAAKPLQARELLASAMERAASQDKRIFLHFGAPWCGWCHQLEDFMALPEVASILSKDFIDLKIDTDRTVGGEEVLAEYCKQPGGIPWFVLLDSEGKALATSDKEQRNIGYPVEPQEIAHFMTMLKSASRQISPDELGKIEKALNDRAVQIRERLNRRSAG